MAKPVKTLLLLILTLAAAVSFRNDFLYFLLGFELMVFAAAWLQCRYISRHIKISAFVPESTAVKGGTFKIYAKLENSGIFPIQQLTARLSLQWYPEEESMLVNGKLMLGSHENGSLCFELDAAHCGCVDIRADMLEVSDSLGIMKRRCEVDRTFSCPLYILPDLSSEGSMPLEAETDVLSNTGSSTRSGRNEPDISEIRTYREGDAIKLIHWKLFARIDELLVRDMSDPVEKLTWLYLDLGEAEGEDVRNDPEAWDNFVETVAGVSATLTRWQRPHMVVWLDAVAGDFIQCRVTDGGSMNEMLCTLLRAQTYPTRDQTQLLREIRQDETKGTCIKISLQGNIARSETEG